MLENKLAAVYGLLLLYGFKADSRIKQICFQVSKLLVGHFYATRTTWNLSDNVNSFFFRNVQCELLLLRCVDLCVLLKFIILSRINIFIVTPPPIRERSKRIGVTVSVRLSVYLSTGIQS